MAPTAQHLSLHDILSIRDHLAKTAEDEFRFELVNANGLLSALTTPFQRTFGAESFPTVLEKAAALTFLLIANHPFRDGNKRIAAAALSLFLERNGWCLRAAPRELEAFTMRLTRSRLRDDHIRAWIGSHSAPR
jgi:death-on-curing protein